MKFFVEQAFFNYPDLLTNTLISLEKLDAINLSKSVPILTLQKPSGPNSEVV